jgi:hypothetical protein
VAKPKPGKPAIPAVPAAKVATAQEKPAVAAAEPETESDNVFSIFGWGD